MRLLYYIIWLIPFTASGQWRLADVFTDHMVFQQQAPIRVWGYGLPGERVEGLLDRDHVTTVVNKDSSWIIEFKKKKFNLTPVSLTCTARSECITLNDVMIGDVWLCLGQSNMEWPMAKEQYFNEERLLDTQPLLRWYNPVYAGKGIYGTPFTDSVMYYLKEDRFYKGMWQVCDSNAMKTMSAVGYYFGKEIMEKRKVPIGLIHLAIGGAPLESFIDAQALRNDPVFSYKVKEDWLHNESLPVWIRERAIQNIGYRYSAAEDSLGTAHPFRPGFAFAAFKSITRMPIKGILFYQGESNSQEEDRVREYKDMFALMVDDYRNQWHSSALPVYFVQLSSIDTLKYKSRLWPDFRNEQLNILKRVRHTGMAVSSDAGAPHDVHPVNKKIIGHRLALWALNKTYGKNLLPCGPVVKNAIFKKDKVIISFRYCERQLSTSDHLPLRGFSLDGITEVSAGIHHKEVRIPCNIKPQYVYYNWKPYADGNLINDTSLPASTFKIKIQ